MLQAKSHLSLESVVISMQSISDIHLFSLLRIFVDVVRCVAASLHEQYACRQRPESCASTFALAHPRDFAGMGSICRVAAVGVHVTRSEIRSFPAAPPMLAPACRDEAGNRSDPADEKFEKTC